MRRRIGSITLTITETDRRWLGCSVCGLDTSRVTDSTVLRRTRFRHRLTSLRRWHRRALAVWRIEHERDPLTGKHLPFLDPLDRWYEYSDIDDLPQAQHIRPYIYVSPEDRPVDDLTHTWWPQPHSAIVRDILACQRYLRRHA